MDIFVPRICRRSFLNRVALGAAALAAPGAFAEALSKTPPGAEGPFYPDKLPLDTDNDLLIVNDQITRAVGEVTHLSGRILDESGSPIRNALVEIWQVDAKACYIHTQDPRVTLRDTNFQGFGRFLTSSSGEYYFRTIKPVPYSVRTPHIHFAVHRPKAKSFVTQCYVKGHPLNKSDFLFRQIPQESRHLVVTDFLAIPDSPAGELAAEFDIVLGHTPAEA